MQLHKCGQSYWLDNLTRATLRNGELRRRISDEGLGGVTANPSTFAASEASGDYDGDIRRLACEGYGTDEIYEKLLVGDVQEAQLLLQRDRPSEGLPLSTALRGKVGVASAKLAYRSFRRVFSGERWDRLAVKGAPVQRPLWASTSTKDPTYRDVLYVEALIGRDTINTMPEQTIRVEPALLSQSSLRVSS